MQKKEPLISIMVAVYNVQDYLRECVESIEAQTITDREVILVDDGSTDNSGALCDELAAIYEDIRVIHKENGGLATARNAGLDAARGKYIGFVDSDDYIAKDMYEKLYKAILQTGCNVACCNWYRCINKGGEYTIQLPNQIQITEMKQLSVEESVRLLLLNRGMTYSACDKLFERTVFDGVRFPGLNRPSEDIPCIYTVLANSKGVVHIGEATYYYRVTEGSISQSKFQAKNISTHEYMEYVEKEVNIKYPQLSKEAIYALVQSASSIYHRMIMSGNSNEFKDIEKSLRKSIRVRMPEILNNPYFGKNAKLVSLMIVLRIYPIFIRLYSKK